MNTKTLTALSMIASLAILQGCNTVNKVVDAVTPAKTEEQKIQKIEPSFKWTYGGYKGEKSKYAGPSGSVMIKDLKIGAKDMAYTWAVSETDAVKMLGSKSKTEIDLYACLFVTTKSGEIVGGKFEWISISRKTRQFTNVFGKYNGWTLANVPNPTEAYFCIVNPKTGARTNFIKATWKR